METWMKNEMNWGTIDLGDVRLNLSAFNALTGDDLSIDEIDALRDTIIRDHKLAALAEEMRGHYRFREKIARGFSDLTEQEAAWCRRFDAIAPGSAEGQS